MPDIFGELARDWHAAEDTMRRLAHPHAATQTPAPQPVNLAAAAAAAPPQEDPMSLAQITDDVREDLTEGLTYVEGWISRAKAAMPAIVSTVDAVSNSTVGKLMEVAAGKFLPPGVEEEFLAIAGRYFSTFGQPAQAAAAAPAAPAAPAPAQQ